eukprot:3331275-Prymnesium_polylepis.3
MWVHGLGLALRVRPGSGTVYGFNLYTLRGRLDRSFFGHQIGGAGEPVVSDHGVDDYHETLI